MPRKNASIPVNKFGAEQSGGISIERIAFEQLPGLSEWEQPERHETHSFFLIEKGSVRLEIDFQKYEIFAPSILYLHPDQVHRIIAFKNVTVCAWAMTHESLNRNYLNLLGKLLPAAPLILNKDDFDLISAAASLCLRIADRKSDRLHGSLLISQANTLAGVVISLLMDGKEVTDNPGGAEVVTKAFRKNLELHFTGFKRPSDYATKLNLSTAYLNECVKSCTGHPATHHIRERVILEAKRLLYHSDQSLKEISAALGFEDYAYFSRLFAKVAGLSPLAFRKNNRV